MPDRDPCVDLEGLWQQLQSPSPVRSLQEEDAQTQGAVAWIAQAWTAIPTPAIPRRPRKLRIARLVVPMAAALLFGALLLLTEPESLPPGPETTARLASAPPRSPSPRLLETSQHQTQVLSGKVRLTMLRGQESPTSTPTTEF